jgi:hypothetical protein
MAETERKPPDRETHIDMDEVTPGREPIKDRRPAVDSYTGEPIPEEEIPDYPISEQSFADELENVPLGEEDAVDFLMLEHNVNDDGVMSQIDDYTTDPEILADFAERQDLAAGSGELYEMLVNYSGRSPDQSADDIDAGWEFVDVSGEESVGGDNPTPDQDIVEELGEALGITYKDTEELDSLERMSSRDENRYELDPASADQDEDQPDPDQDADDDQGLRI